MRPLLLGMVIAAMVAAACATSDEDDSGQAAGDVPTAGDTELASAAAAAVASHEIPAAALATVDLDGVVRVGVAGVLSHADDTPIGIDSRFHLGSDTKAMTAVLVGQLAATGELGLDSLVAQVLPDATMAPSLAGLTVRQALSHQTGLVDNLDLRALHQAADPVAARRDAVYASLSNASGTPGSYSYANVNYMLAGVIVETIAGRPWTEVITERIFVPLGMDSCGFGAPSGPADPLGHAADGTPITLDGPVTDNPPALGPAGTVHCSVGDWAKFAGSLLDALSGTDSQILSAIAASELFAGSEAYVAGWVRSDQGGMVEYGHDGSNTLWYARAMLRPERGDAILIAVNTGETSGVDAVDELTGVLLKGK